MIAVFFVIFKDVLKIQLLTEGGEKRDFFFFKDIVSPLPLKRPLSVWEMAVNH